MKIELNNNDKSFIDIITFIKNISGEQTNEGAVFLAVKEYYSMLFRIIETETENFKLSTLVSKTIDTNLKNKKCFICEQFHDSEGLQFCVSALVYKNCQLQKKINAFQSFVHVLQKNFDDLNLMACESFDND
jgi:hypothetical protein